MVNRLACRGWIGSGNCSCAISFSREGAAPRLRGQLFIRPVTYAAPAMIWGTRHTHARRLAFRNDWCRTCRKPVRAARTRTWWWFTVFWIPLLPLGVRRRWLCDECGFPAHAVAIWGARRRLVLALLLALGAVGLWIEPPPTAAEEPELFAVFRWIVTLVPVALAISTWWRRNDPSLAQGLQQVAATEDRHCPYCSVALVHQRGVDSCPRCGIERATSVQPG